MTPKGTGELEVGMRVCAYWSSHMTYLHPGTVSAPDTDASYVVIQLDDGDSRLVEVDKIRMLPCDYSRVGKK